MRLRVFLPNGIFFCPTALAGRTSVTRGHMDRRTDHVTLTSVAIDRIAFNDDA